MVLSPKNVKVKSSRLNKKGVFALRNFKKGEIVLKWRSKKLLTKKQVSKLPISQKHYISTYTHGQYLMQRSPERYVNHSCSPNTRVKNNSDVAIRDIKRGEEITSDYSKDNDGIQIHFKCRCSSKNCKKLI